MIVRKAQWSSQKIMMKEICNKESSDILVKNQQRLNERNIFKDKQLVVNLKMSLISVFLLMLGRSQEQSMEKSVKIFFEIYGVILTLIIKNKNIFFKINAKIWRNC